MVAHANMIVGADITYIGLGQNKYQVNLRLIKDCSFNLAKDTETVYINTPTSLFSDSLKLPLVSLRTIGDFYCAGKTTCEGGINPGFQELVYSGTLELAGIPHCDFILSYSNGSRPKGLTNGGSGSPIYVRSTLNKCIAPNNSSPDFTATPRLFSNVGRDEAFSIGMADTMDRDIILAEQGQPMINATTAMAYEPAYGVDRPLFFYGYPDKNLALPRGFHLDSAYGTYNFRSIGDGAYVMNVRLDEYRNGPSGLVKIAEVNREWVMIVRTNFSSRNPVISGPDEVVACVGKRTCFNVTTSDPDFDSTFLHWTYDISGANATTNNGILKNSNSTFCWAPTVDDIRATPYLITVEARDNRCEYNGYSSKTIMLRVLGDTGLKATIIKSIDNCGQYTFKPLITGGTPPYTYSWTGDDGLSSTDSTVTHKYRTQGIYNLKLEVSSSMGCSFAMKTDTVNIIKDYTFKVSLGSDFSVCKGTFFNLHANVTGSNSPYSIKWMGYPDTIPDLVSIGNNPSQYIVIAENQEGCIERDTVKVDIFNSISVDAGASPQNVCVSDNPISLGGLPVGGNWSGNGVLNNVFTPNDAGVGSHALVYTVRSLDGCDNRDTIHYIVVNNPVVNAGRDTILCKTSGMYTLQGYPNGGSWSGPWVSNNLFDVNAAGAGTYFLTYNVFNGVGCNGVDSVQIIVRDTLPWLDVITFDQELCTNSGTLTLEALPLGGKWSGPGVSGNTFDPAAVGPGVYTVTYTATYNSCTVDSSITLKVHETPVVDAGSYYPMVFCTVSSEFMLGGIPEGGYWTGTGVFLRNFDGKYYFNPKTAGAGTHVLTYHYGNGGCTISDTTSIVVTTTPIPVINVNNPTGPAPLTVKFKDVNPNTNFWIWNFGDPGAGLLNTSDLREPTFTYYNPGTYVVTLFGGKDACADRKPVTKTIVVTLPMGVLEDMEKSGWSIYPNPNNGQFEIRLQSGNITGWSVTDMSGRQLRNSRVQADNMLSLDMSELSNGIYLVRITDDTGKVYQGKVSIQH